MTQPVPSLHDPELLLSSPYHRQLPPVPYWVATSQAPVPRPTIRPGKATLDAAGHHDEPGRASQPARHLIVCAATDLSTAWQPAVQQCIQRHLQATAADITVDGQRQGDEAEMVASLSGLVDEAVAVQFLQSPDTDNRLTLDYSFAAVKSHAAEQGRPPTQRGTGLEAHATKTIPSCA